MLTTWGCQILGKGMKGMRCIETPGDGVRLYEFGEVRQFHPFPWAFPTVQLSTQIIATCQCLRMSTGETALSLAKDDLTKVQF